MGSSDDFWNDIYGDLYDFNGDGKTDVTEVMMAHHIDEQWRKSLREKDDSTSNYDDFVPEYSEYEFDHIEKAFVYETYSEYILGSAKIKIPHKLTEIDYNKASKAIQGYKSDTVMVIIFYMVIAFVITYGIFSIGGFYSVFFGIVVLLIGAAIAGILIYAAKDDFKRAEQLQEILDRKYKESKYGKQ